MRACAEDHLTAARAAETAGRLLVAVRQQMAGAPHGEVAEAGDRQSHDELLSVLSALCPLDAVLSEEGADDQARFSAPRVWIVDPLDGSREFAEGRSDWAVHVALVVGGELSAGAVALPALNRTMWTGSPPDPPGERSGPLRLAVSRTRPPAFADALRRDLGAEFVPMGSAGAKAMAVVTGDADVYAHAGGQYEWDSAAPVAVAASAGLHVSRIDGSPLRYNQVNPWLPDLLICRSELASDVIALVKREIASS